MESGGSKLTLCLCEWRQRGEKNERGEKQRVAGGSKESKINKYETLRSN